MLYRVKQFIWAIKSNFKDVDYDFVKQFLDEDELKLFIRLGKDEQHHSIRVCNDAIEIANKNKQQVNMKSLAKMALLHDVGKVVYHLNPIEKSILVLLHKGSKGKISRFSNIKAIDSYYNHSLNSVNILSNKKYSKDFLDAIEKHHNNENSSNKLLNILREADNKN